MQPKQLKVINKMEFKDRLQKLMDEKGITSYNIGINTSVKKQSVIKYLNGTKPTSKKLQELADYLGTTTDYLLNGSENDMFVDDIIMKNEKPE